MIRKVLSFIAVLFVMPVAAHADSYTKLWESVTEAEKKDLPKTQIKHLQAIADKAEKEAAYGQLLKAEWKMVEKWASISTDSIQPQIDRLEQKAARYEASAPALAAVCYAALGRIYMDNAVLGDGREQKAEVFFKKALANPALLAANTATDYEPFVIRGRDSRIFNDDLLSLVGYAAADYETMNAYYKGTGNRAATMITALEMLKKHHERDCQKTFHELKKSEYAVSLDSLRDMYSDLKECGEIAIERYGHMKICTDVSIEDRVGYINKAVAQWGEWPHINVLRNDLKMMTDPQFSVNIGGERVLPDHPFNLVVSARNIRNVFVSIKKLNIGGDTKLSPQNANDYAKLKKLIVGGTARDIKKPYIGVPDYRNVTDTLEMEGLPTGVYLVEAATDNKGISPSRALLYVSGLQVVYQQLPDKKLRVAVLDVVTGQPVHGATVLIVTDDDRRQSQKCGDDGETIFSLDEKRMAMVRAFTAKDNASPLVGAWSRFYFYNDSVAHERVKLYTDRKMYRPGQTVHVAGIVTTCTKMNTKVLAGRTIRLTLKDANYQTVAEKSVTTDDYGTLSADFQLPASGLTGSYQVRSDLGSDGFTSFNVEEYKRPTFTVDFPEINQTYHNGDTLVVTAHAKSYAGVAVQGAKVKYTVRRSQPMWWRLSSAYVPFNTDETDVLFSGETVTDNDGAFNIEMPMLLPAWKQGVSGRSEQDFYRIARIYNITAEADVTDVSGETRHGELSLPLSNKAAVFGLKMPEKSVRDSLKTITFTLKNAAGNNVEGDVSYHVEGLSETFVAKANVPTDISGSIVARLKSGRHTLTAVCNGDTLRHEFIVFGIDDTVPCVETSDWCYVSNTTFPVDGSPIYIQVGSSDEKVHMLYTVVSGDKVIKSGTADISNRIETGRIQYKEEYGDGLLLNVIWVKNGTVYKHGITLRKPLPDKRLLVKWTTFRDRLTPGQKEEWTLNITKPDGTAADAQLMATLYDASLDQIKPFSWDFTNRFSLSLPYSYWGSVDFNAINLSRYLTQKRFDTNALDFNRMDLGRLYRHVFIRGYGSGVKKYKAQLDMVTVEKQSASAVMGYNVSSNKMAAPSVKEESADAGEAIGRYDGVVEDESSAGYVQEKDIPVRENLNETAFFYPTLRTDADGNVNIRFTLPESITTWKLLGLAHDRDVNHGTVTAEAVAKKTVMVQPNMPRFIRKGDLATISTKIFNTSEKAVKGIAAMQLTDPETGRTVFTQRKNFSVGAEETASVTFEYSSATDASLLVCKITAAGKEFSDGEQHYLPILSDEETVTNTAPFTQHGPGVKTIDLGKLFSEKGRNERLTVEYTNNPAWLMIQTLPYLGSPSNDNSISLATAFYANSIAAHIMKQSPRIQSVFQQWMNEPQKESLASNLERNQELKNIVLNETPWLLEASDESAGKLRLASYFNTASLENSLNSILAKLQEMQRADGSWCWWKGGKYGSPYLTIQIAEMMTRLNNMTGGSQQTKGMLDKAFKFIGKEMTDYVSELRKAEKKGQKIFVGDLSSVRTLYIYALDGRKMTASERAAADYLLAVLKERNAESSLYVKSLMAVVLAKRGETKLAAEYIKSLEEYSVGTKEMGRYYDSPRATYSWFDNRIPTQVAVIEAMTLVDAQKNASEIDSMKRWLLQQKRVQGWNTPVNSVNAVYAFLNGNTSILENKVNTTFAIDGKQLDMPQATAGTGYVKTTVAGQKQGVFTASKASDGTSWGAVYAQSLQKTADIAPASAGLSITREILSADGKPQTTFQKGDRVKVRITVTAERNYDFVQITDKRAGCLEPAEQLSGYRPTYLEPSLQLGGYRNGYYYCAPKDNSTNYYFDTMSKGKHVIETVYYADRAGRYETGTCSAQCAYAPEYSAHTSSATIEVK